MTTEARPRIAEDQAILNITWAGQNGDLADPIPRDLADEEVRRVATEAIRGGGARGIPVDASADLSGFVVDRFGPSEDRAWNLVQVRPKTPFGCVSPGTRAPRRPYDGRCPACGSSKIWDDATFWGCNDCGGSSPQ